MRLIYVPIGLKTLETLVAIARKERRRPQDQAAYFIDKAVAQFNEGTPSDKPTTEVDSANQ